MVLLARKDEEGNTQALYDHLHGAGRLASGFEDEFADIQAFQTVSDNFHVIPDVTHNVVVPYGQATELLDMLHRGELSEKISVLRRLQEYTVSLFDDDYRDLARKHAISLANEDFGVFLLNEEYYNDKYGVVREAEMPLLLM